MILNIRFRIKRRSNNFSRFIPNAPDEIGEFLAVISSRIRKSTDIFTKLILIETVLFVLNSFFFFVASNQILNKFSIHNCGIPLKHYIRSKSN